MKNEELEFSSFMCPAGGSKAEDVLENERESKLERGQTKRDTHRLFLELMACSLPCFVLYSDGGWKGKSYPSL